MRTLNVGIASFEEMKARTLAIARGDLAPRADDPKIWFTSTESFAKVLSAKNRELLRVIAERTPESLERLATLTHRAKSNLSRTLKKMEALGLVELRRGERGRVVPRMVADSVTLNLSLKPESAGKKRPAV